MRIFSPLTAKAILAASIVAMAGCATPEDSEAVSVDAEDSFSFIVIGDTPYNKADEEMLVEALPVIKAGNYPFVICLLYTSPSPRDQRGSRMPSSA